MSKEFSGYVIHENKAIQCSDGRPFRVAPHEACPICGGALILGNPLFNEWHCINAGREEGAEFIRHYKASRNHARRKGLS